MSPAASRRETSRAPARPTRRFSTNALRFDKWYGDPPDCELQRRRNFCKGYGVRYCAAVAECGVIMESECLARYDDPQCWARWDSYVYCFSRDGTCGSCADRLPEWEQRLTAPICIECRCDSGCTTGFVMCSGLPSDECN